MEAQVQALIHEVRSMHGSPAVSIPLPEQERSSETYRTIGACSAPHVDHSPNRQLLCSSPQTHQFRKCPSMFLLMYRYTTSFAHDDHVGPFESYFQPGIQDGCMASGTSAEVTYLEL